MENNISKEEVMRKYDLTEDDLSLPRHKLFLKIAKPNKDGYSKAISIEELAVLNEKFRTGNGGDWCRSDGSIGKMYNIDRIKEKGRIVGIRLDGFNKNPQEKKISESIKMEIIKRHCVLLDIGTQIECDHKNGKYNDRHMEDTSKQTINDFQPLCRAANLAKRQHCKECRETGIRYDARRLGYKEPFILGDFKSKNCAGCYFYDPLEFNREMTKNYVKEL